MTFERIVRPFQTVQVSPAAQPAYLAPDEELENIILEFGRDGRLKDVPGNSSSSMTSFTKTESKEISRVVSEPRRVENPDDPSQYVEVEDTEEIETESGSRDTYERRIIKFMKDIGARFE